jgi:hypothetical protein
MRHLRSILYALVLAPAVWVLAGVGFTHDLTSRGRDFFTAESLSGLLLLIFAGILFAIMAFSPISPLGPTISGAVFLGVTYWAWSSPSSYAGVWSPDVVKDGFDLSRPGYGLAALLAVPLLCTALSARRWARYEPPVLPIIGEIGRFRGSAKVAGINVAAAETTVFRTAQPPAAQADRTQVLRTSPAASPQPSPISGTGAAPSADATVALPATGAAPFGGGPRVAAASDETTTIFAASKPPAPAGAASQSEGGKASGTATPPATSRPSGPTGLSASGNQRPNAPEAAKSNKSGITANPAIAADAGKIASQTPVQDDKTVAMTPPAPTVRATTSTKIPGAAPTSGAGAGTGMGAAPISDVAANPAQAENASAETAAAKPAIMVSAQGTGAGGDETTVLPAQPAAEKGDRDATTVLAPSGTDEHTEVLKIPAQ